MHCPVCGQQQMSGETRFCSRCGFPLTGVAELIATGGAAATSSVQTGKESPRKRGLKQGLFVFLLTFLIVPIVAMISMALKLEPVAVAITSVILFVGGILRMIYALMFESGTPGELTLEERLLSSSKAKALKEQPQATLPPQRSVPASAYSAPTGGSWRDTNELVPNQPASVTDNTTKLLHEDQES